ncbi:DUF3761 domain-containing protein [Ralstonia solanacearum]|uniref:DUF3761 domain-containing protein n=1 Tax=Ralstonia solanacearum TaxID=305 RepID=UPI0018D0835C|nr:DUF3761 domain-containing protein [Ralstonia solanacearum]
MVAIALAVVLGIATATAALPSFAKSPRQHSSSPDEGQLVEHGHYVNKQGHDIHSPAHTKDGKAPNGATAKCRDRSYSFSESRRGTCSRHGCVADWLQ